MSDIKYIYRGQVSKVVDGDTVDMVVDLGFKVGVGIRFRLAGIDAPEMHGVEKVDGQASKLFLENYLKKAKNNNIFIECIGKDKYGRWVAYLTFDDEDNVRHNVSERLLNEGFAKPYSG